MVHNLYTVKYTHQCIVKIEHVIYLLGLVFNEKKIINRSTYHQCTRCKKHITQSLQFFLIHILITNKNNNIYMLSLL